MKITKEQFIAYKKGQKSGVTNMWDVNKVVELSGLKKEMIIEIMSRFNSLEEKYNV